MTSSLQKSLPLSWSVSRTVFTCCLPFLVIQASREDSFYAHNSIILLFFVLESWPDRTDLQVGWLWHFGNDKVPAPPDFLVDTDRLGAQPHGRLEFKSLSYIWNPVLSAVFTTPGPGWRTEIGGRWKETKVAGKSPQPSQARTIIRIIFMPCSESFQVNMNFQGRPGPPPVADKI